jgi:hypothetical protein
MEKYAPGWQRLRRSVATDHRREIDIEAVLNAVTSANMIDNDSTNQPGRSARSGSGWAFGLAISLAPGIT